MKKLDCLSNSLTRRLLAWVSESGSTVGEVGWSGSNKEQSCSRMTLTFLVGVTILLTYNSITVAGAATR